MLHIGPLQLLQGANHNAESATSHEVRPDHGTKTLHVHVWRRLATSMSQAVTSRIRGYLLPSYTWCSWARGQLANRPGRVGCVGTGCTSRASAARAFWDEVASSEVVLVQPSLTVALAQ